MFFLDLAAKTLSFGAQKSIKINDNVLGRPRPLSKRFQDAFMKPHERARDASGKLLDRSGIDFGPLGIDFGTDFGTIFDLKTSPDGPS